LGGYAVVNEGRSSANIINAVSAVDIIVGALVKISERSVGYGGITSGNETVTAHFFNVFLLAGYQSNSCVQRNKDEVFGHGLNKWLTKSLIIKCTQKYVFTIFF